MNKHRLWGAAALAAILVAQGAQAQTPIPPAPKDFVMAAAQSDQYEIMAGHIAVVEGHDPRVRTFAEAMIRDHTRLTDDLRHAAMAAGLPPPGLGMSSDQAALLGGLQSLRGAEFDMAYIRQQELAHVQAIAVEDSFSAAGADNSLKEAAQAALPRIEDHLKMVRQLGADLAVK